MSVRECLEFAAKLKLSGSLESKIERVNNINAKIPKSVDL